MFKVQSKLCCVPFFTLRATEFPNCNAAPLFCFRYSDLLISAPYHGEDEGRVYVYINDGKVSRFELLSFFLYYIIYYFQILLRINGSK